MLYEFNVKTKAYFFSALAKDVEEVHTKRHAEKDRVDEESNSTASSTASPSSDTPRPNAITSMPTPLILPANVLMNTEAKYKISRASHPMSGPPIYTCPTASNGFMNPYYPVPYSATLPSLPYLPNPNLFLLGRPAVTVASPMVKNPLVNLPKYRNSSTKTTSPKKVFFKELTATLATMDKEQDQKELLGENLFPLIKTLEPGLAGKITGMLLEMDNTEVLKLLDDYNGLRAKVAEAKDLLVTNHYLDEPAKKGTTPVLAENNLSSLLATLQDQQDQKNLLGFTLFPRITELAPSCAGKVTGMLLEMDNKELLALVDHPKSLKAKVAEAVAVLKAHKAKEG